MVAETKTATDSLTQAAIDNAKQTRRQRTLAQMILDRQDLMEASPERQRFDALNREIIDYMRIDLAKYRDDSQAKGDTRGVYQRSSFTATTLEHTADAYCGNVFTPDWFQQGLTEKWANDFDVVQKWMQDCDDHMAAKYEESGFYEVQPQLAMDAFSIGDGFVFLGQMEGEDAPYHAYSEFMQTWIIRDHRGNIIGAHRRCQYNALDAYRRWGTKCSAALCAEAEGNRPVTEHSFIHAIYLCEDPILDGLEFFRERPFIELWIEEKSEKNQWGYLGHNDVMDGILSEDGYWTMPLFDWPYWLKSSETYGRGPLLLATAKRYHIEYKGVMLAAQRGTSPPLKGSKTLENHTDINPDGITWTQNGEDLSPVYPGGSIRYDFGTDLLERTEEQIRDALNLPLFLQMSLAKKEMRVDEVRQRIGERAAALAPRIGTQQRYLLTPHHARMWQIEWQARRLPQMPPQIQEAMMMRQISGKTVITYRGPLSTARDQMFAARRIGGGLEIATALAQFDQGAVRRRIDVSKTLEEGLDKTGFYQGGIRSDEQVAQMEQRELEAAQAQLAAEIGKSATGSMLNAAKADTEVAKQAQGGSRR